MPNPPDTRTMRERAAQALWDSIVTGPKWGATGEALRFGVYCRIDYMAAAGVIADGLAEAERDQAIEDRNRWQNAAAAWEANANRALRAVVAVTEVCSSAAAAEISTSSEAAREFLAKLHAALIIPTPKGQT